MNDKDRTMVVTNYYVASNALMEIGINKDIPDELKNLAMQASIATVKIIDYVNSHRE